MICIHSSDNCFRYQNWKLNKSHLTDVSPVIMTMIMELCYPFLYFQITCRQAECEYLFLLKQPCPKYHRTLRFQLAHSHTLYRGSGLNSDLLTESQKYQRPNLAWDPFSENVWGFGSGTSIFPTPSEESDVQATLGTIVRRSFPLTYTYCSHLSFLTCTMRISVMHAIL